MVQHDNKSIDIISAEFHLGHRNHLEILQSILEEEEVSMVVNKKLSHVLQEIAKNTVGEAQENYRKNP